MLSKHVGISLFDNTFLIETGALETAAVTGREKRREAEWNSQARLITSAKLMNQSIYRKVICFNNHLIVLVVFKQI